MSVKFRRAFCYLIGLFILAVGITFTIISNLGAGAWDALSVGLSVRFGLTVGTWVILIGVILIIVNALIAWSRPEIHSLLTVIILGYFIDFWLVIVFQDIRLNELPVQAAVLLSGVTLMGLGISTYLQADFAIIPIDRLMLNLKQLLRLPLMGAKTVAEIIALVAALLVGGPIGVGTIIVTLSIGPLIQVFYKRVKRIVSV
ncbi:YczE/YyaS/YitT family protein [Alkalihalobacterium chitinilyticum]|uniref:Membrane protein n=1 Tax=Alkalihalobacterium chitinilyticum TaxID=2980103 RepID=A0ABT5VH09_9BACI|nr:membrane protein [Alkalihalobacterium chitinilyticum]MDE5414739.1 membrane protein [Alkalihalobacterium chitinilyticum]